ncbi:alpha/beta fold hydrolase [Falsiroseomonas selenitidurans]|uniref:Alpha/beta hydrolase n=1 Tax=Falsiroseomonas selenitidurans TaxID=2716335 RepID=A0ABX1E9N5_9PROT|nr:hypothetical protein [Falsiroseomonas selenitidurans]NKC33909.1 hypothetical protein [Falsiroseomonas selenitidurans]
MIRAALLMLLLALPARAEQAGPFHTEAGVAARDGGAVGALVWLHPYYTEGDPPPPPAWAQRMAARGWDLWRHDWLVARQRSPQSGPRNPNALTGGVEALAQGSAALRARGYRRVVLLGESRGAFMALAALREAGLADAVLLASPAAHGTRVERRPQALADFRAALERANPRATGRIALLQFAEDHYNPDPALRAAWFRAAVARLGWAGLLVDQPAAPTGHGGVQDEDFDPIFGGCLAAFLDFDRAPPATCP